MQRSTVQVSANEMEQRSRRNRSNGKELPLGRIVVFNGSTHGLEAKLDSKPVLVHAVASKRLSGAESA